MVYSLPNFTNGSTGIEDIIYYEASQVNGFVGGLLLLIYVVILGAGYFAQERRTGAGNIAMWSAISGLITTTGAFILFLYDIQNTGIVLVNIEVVIISLLITIVSVVWFILSDRE